MQRVAPEAMVLKPNMVVPGLAYPTQAIVDEVADATVRCLLRTVPAAVPGVAFHSWALAFSFARAIQQPALEVWRGEDANVPAAQQALYHRADYNRAARRAEYTAAMEKRRT